MGDLSDLKCVSDTPIRHVSGVSTSLLLSPALSGLVYGAQAVVMFGAMFVCSAVGLCLFGGEVYHTNQAFGVAPDGTSLALEKEENGDVYLAINYNSLSCGMNALVQLMIGNNWNTYVDTMAYVSNNSQAPRADPPHTDHNPANNPFDLSCNNPF